MTTQVPGAPAALPPRARQQWEYATTLVSVVGRYTGDAFQKERAKFDKVLADAGTKGWELVSVKSLGDTGGLTGSANHNMMLIFKRPAPIEQV